MRLLHSYFTTRFPHLLLAVWMFALKHLADEPQLASAYWPQGAHLYQPFLKDLARRHRVHAPPRSASASASLLAAGTQAPAPLPPARAGTIVSEVSEGADGAGGDRANEPPSPTQVRGLNPHAAPHVRPQGSAQELSLPATASAPASTAAATAAGLVVVVGYEEDPEAAAADGGSGAGPGAYVREFPRRPGKQMCDFYAKTGHCKFGDSCVFDHPVEHAVYLTQTGLPVRPGQPVCAFYLKNNECKFGPACKFNHPVLRPVYAGSSLVVVGAGGTGSGNSREGDGQG